MSGGRITAAAARQQIAEVGDAAFFDTLVANAQKLARVPVSGFDVGAVALGSSGQVYLGANIEFSGAALASSIHAEQCAIVNARDAGETGLDLLVVSHMPCGHCRQFLMELRGAKALRVRVDGREHTLDELLVDAFDPRDLGFSSSVLDQQPGAVTFASAEDLARSAAQRSYAQYSEARAGVALQHRNGAAIAAGYIESVAYNPSLPPLQAALALSALDGWNWDDVTGLTLAHRRTKIDHEPATRLLVDTIWSRRVELRVLTV